MSDQVISAPNAEDIKGLAEQAVRVGQLAIEHLGTDLAGDESDLDILQRLLDSRRIPADATFDLQCMGIVFGMRVCEASEGIDWAIVQDEYGRDPALRYLDTSLLVFPLTMISKRVEDGDQFSVRELFDGLLEQLEHLKGDVDRPS